MTSPRLSADLEILAANRDLALAEAESATASGWYSSASHSQGQAVAYAEAIRILSRPEPVSAPVVEPWQCSSNRALLGAQCVFVGSLVAPDGRRYCTHHAPADVTLTISEHDDPRNER